MADSGKFHVPCVRDVISVCYVDADEEPRNASYTTSDSRVQWWSATITAVLPVYRSGEITCIANVSFWPDYNQPRQECTMLFLTNGLVIDLLVYDGDKNNTSEWRYISRAADGEPPNPVQNADEGRRRCNAPPSSADGRASPAAARSNGNCSTARAGNGGARSRSRPSTVQANTNKRMAELGERLTHMEAEFRVLKRKQFTELEVDIVKEIRVETKLGLIDVLRRAPGGLHVTEGGSELEAVIQGGIIKWSYKCCMGRYKLLAAAVHEFFCEGMNKKPSAVKFSPSFERLQSVCGFGTSEISFATAMDLMRFLGITNTDDIDKMVKFPYDAAGGRHLRVLGALQDGTSDECATLAMFVGHSAVRDSFFLPPTWLGAKTNPTNEGHANNVFFSNATWDSDNSCFAAQPSLGRSSTGFNEIASTECSSFKIHWEIVPPKLQRTVSHMTVDTEGVRRGTLVVEMPFYRLAPYLASLFSKVWEEQ